MKENQLKMSFQQLYLYCQIVKRGLEVDVFNNKNISSLLFNINNILNCFIKIINLTFNLKKSEDKIAFLQCKLYYLINKEYLNKLSNAKAINFYDSNIFAFLLCNFYDFFIYLTQIIFNNTKKRASKQCLIYQRVLKQHLERYINKIQKKQYNIINIIYHIIFNFYHFTIFLLFYFEKIKQSTCKKNVKKLGCKRCKMGL